MAHFDRSIHIQGGHLPPDCHRKNLPGLENYFRKQKILLPALSFFFFFVQAGANFTDKRPD
jgi:hypothetical protein